MHSYWQAADSQALSNGWYQVKLQPDDVQTLPSPGQYLLLASHRIWPLQVSSGALEALAPVFLQPGRLYQGTVCGQPARVEVPSEPVFWLGKDNGALAMMFYCLQSWPALHNKITRLLMEFSELPAVLPQPSQIWLPEMPPGVIASLRMFDDRQLPGRLCSATHPLPGCFDGTAQQLLSELKGSWPASPRCWHFAADLPGCLRN